MNDYIRLSTGFFDHYKTKKLIKRLGFAGIVSLTKLWVWAAVNKPNGDLSGINEKDIALAAEWPGEPGSLIDNLVSIGWLDKDGLGYRIHGWQEHQPHLKIYTATKRLYSRAWKRIKAIVFKRDKHTCVYCGASEEQMHCDHAIPISRGGDNSLSNLVTACPGCNRKKGPKTPEEWLS